jgi:hypothetical protein
MGIKLDFSFEDTHTAEGVGDILRWENIRIW